MYIITINNTIANYDILGKLKRNCPYCGKDSTSRLTNALNAAMKEWNDKYSQYTNNILKYSFYRMAVRWNAMANIGPNLDFKVEWEGDLSGVQCPSTDACQETYEICGVCVHDHFIGNLMYGFWMRLFDFSNFTTYAGGHIYQIFGKSDDGTRKGGWRLDYPYDQAGYELGDALYKSNISSFTNSSVCDIIKNHNAFDRANKTGKDYSKCQKCPLVKK